MTEETRQRRTRYPPVLWPVDVAELLGFPSERAALDWMRAERIPVVKIAGRARVLFRVLMGHLERMSEAVVDERTKLKTVAGRLRRRQGRSVDRAVAKLKGA